LKNEDSLSKKRESKELSRNEKIKFYGFGFITSAVLLLFGSYLIIKNLD
jgi:hypothetical protein